VPCSSSSENSYSRCYDLLNGHEALPR